MSFTIRILIFGTLLFLIDLYFYQAVSTILKGAAAGKRHTAFYIYWGFTILSFLVFLFPVFLGFQHLPQFVRVYVVPLFVLVIISKLIGSLFLTADDIIRLFRWAGSYLFHTGGGNGALTTETSIAGGEANTNPHSISRLTFLNYAAVTMATLPYASFIYGMVKGAFAYKVHTTKVILPRLPDEFNGFKIVQISDIHSGSFTSDTHITEAVKIVMQQNADIIFFTGDLVNNRADETTPFIDVFKKVKAPMGVYSILGNHDYGDYIQWDSAEEKAQNLHDLKNVHAQVGWKLLLNEHVVLKKGDAAIALLGIENWGGQLHFPKYGDMKKAHAGTENYPVKLLLSHDPSHWNMQVLKNYKDIDITFSGHTHGFQFGIEIPGFKWSPSQYIYKQWAGLYSDGKQHLYVNRGLGFLGYPGRVGIMPEITVMELSNS